MDINYLKIFYSKYILAETWSNANKDFSTVSMLSCEQYIKMINS